MQNIQSNAWRFNKLLKNSQWNCNQGLTERKISWPGLEMKEPSIALSGQCCDVTEFHTFLRPKKKPYCWSLVLMWQYILLRSEMHVLGFVQSLCSKDFFLTDRSVVGCQDCLLWWEDSSLSQSLLRPWTGSRLEVDSQIALPNNRAHNLLRSCLVNTEETLSSFISIFLIKYQRDAFTI